MSKTQAVRSRLRSILVAVADPAGSRQHAVDKAAQLAKAVDARLVLFHAAFDSSLSGWSLAGSRRLASMRGAFVANRTRSLERHASMLRRAGLGVDVCVVWENPAHEAITRQVLREGADLVVVGRHEHDIRRASQFRLTDWELMRSCPRPLLVTHPGTDMNSPGAILAALDPTHANAKPAELEAAILRNAAVLADALQVECHAVHCRPASAYPLGVGAAGRERDDLRAYSRMKQLIRKAGVAVDGVHVVRGPVHEALPEFARKLPAQAVAMGVISRRGMQRFAIGDTAETVIRDMPCDLLLIKPDNFRLRLGRSRKEAIVLPRTRAGRRRQGS